MVTCCRRFTELVLEVDDRLVDFVADCLLDRLPLRSTISGQRQGLPVSKLTAVFTGSG